MEEGEEEGRAEGRAAPPVDQRRGRRKAGGESCAARRGIRGFGLSSSTGVQGGSCGTGVKDDECLARRRWGGEGEVAREDKDEGDGAVPARVHRKGRMHLVRRRSTSYTEPFVLCTYAM